MGKTGKQNDQVKNIICGVIACTALGGFTVLAEEPAEYSLQQMVVTATRYEKADLDTPASTTVITQKELKEKGYNTVFEAIEHTPGASAYAYATGGEGYGGMYARINLRGFDKGTLVLVNGMPVNLKNYNSIISAIPVSAVDHIEIVRGSNAVMYGTQAIGGVINIITKTAQSGKPSASISGELGNYNSHYEAGITTDRLVLGVRKEYMDSFPYMNKLFSQSTDRKYKDKETRDSAFMSYRLTDELTLNYAYSQLNSHFKAYKYDGTTGGWTKLSKNYFYKDDQQTGSLIYRNQSGLRSAVSYTADKFRAHGGSDSSTDEHSYTWDTQKEWNVGAGNDVLIGGFTMGKEYFRQNSGDHTGSFSRNSYAPYLSYTKNWNQRFSTILGARANFVEKNTYDASQRIFLPQIQTLYKIRDNLSWYINVGKAFQMPDTGSPFYGTKVSHAVKLNPEKSWNYETGMKYDDGMQSLKLAVFHMNVKNMFKWVKEDTVIADGDPNTYIQINADRFKNTGIEAVYGRRINDAWSWNVSATWADPKSKEDGSSWSQETAKQQYTAGLNYHKGKWTADLDLLALAEQPMSNYTRTGKSASSAGEDHRIDNRYDINFTARCQVTPQDSISAGFYNILNRKNPVNIYEYYELPFNFRIGYSHNF